MLELELSLFLLLFLVELGDTLVLGFLILVQTLAAEEDIDISVWVGLVEPVLDNLEFLLVEIGCEEFFSVLNGREEDGGLDRILVFLEGEVLGELSNLDLDTEIGESELSEVVLDILLEFFNDYLITKGLFVLDGAITLESGSVLVLLLLGDLN